jgi:hypothetical protein
MASFRKRGAVWYFRFVDADGVKRTRKGCSDRRATEELARDAEAQAARIRAGLVDARDLARRDHQARPLSEHLTVWGESLAAKGGTTEHVALSMSRARRIAALVMGAKLTDIDPPSDAKRSELARYEAALAKRVESARLSDLAADPVQKALATLRAEGRSLATCNHHRTAIRSFAKWCHDTHRTRDNALRAVKGFNVKEDRRHDRRTISLDELTRLIAVAQRGPAFRAMTGPARALCYRLAASTGLRYSEIATIRPTSFDWKAPSVTIQAAYTKNGDPGPCPSRATWRAI